MSLAAATRFHEGEKMKRYHFSIAGTLGHIGLAGAIFAEKNEEALRTLQATLDGLHEHHIIENYDGEEPSLDDVEPGLSYIALYGNDIKATMQMFDEIEGDDDSD